MTQAPTTLPAAAAAEERPGSALLGGLLRYAFLFAFAAMFVFFSLRTPTFLGGSNLLNILQGSALLTLVALALTVVVAAGGIDLSVGVALDFGAWFSIVAMLSFGLPWPVALLCGLAGGALIGAVNAFLIVQLGVTPFLATLGTFFIGRSAQLIGTNGGANINFRQMPEGFQAVAGGSALGVSNQLVVVAVIAALYYLLLNRSKYGARIGAMGIQNSAARVAGIPTRKYRATVFVLAGLTAGVAGVLLSSDLRIYTPNAGFSYLLDGIAAVFIGASMHRDSRPNVLGTIVGVLFLSTLRVGLDLLGLDFNVKAALNGIVLLAALVLAYAVSKRARRT
ncbi:ABC transporter permease [Leucobacter sp. CSA1]|uniref:ABC transporter permease n=1 Tax=Leucobacter chromiisoli TaxID=2796471 RepID=A0A934UUZ1_9MICO|nr:ABC transporter permease [Leucobacter chromiisoli]MBK0418412.1 ABC transporter permease [Leucobacter chromiisoli]